MITGFVSVESEPKKVVFYADVFDKSPNSLRSFYDTVSQFLRTHNIVLGEGTVREIGMYSKKAGFIMTAPVVSCPDGLRDFNFDE